MITNIILYKVESILANENNIYIPDIETYLANRSIKEVIPENLRPKRIKNIYDLKNEITLYLNGREPMREYNYLRVTQEGKDHYFFITGYEELGANQVKYELIKDTLNTEDIDYEASNALVTREHKDRYRLRKEVVNGRPRKYFESIINNTIEEADYIPSKIEDVSNFDALESDKRMIMSLVSFGGNSIGDKLLSVPKNFWEIELAEDGPEINYNVNNNLVMSLELGWGVQVESTSSFLIFKTRGTWTNAPYLSDLPVNTMLRWVKSGTKFVIQAVKNGVKVDITSDMVTNPVGSGWSLSNGMMLYNEASTESPHLDITFNFIDTNGRVFYDLGIEQGDLSNWSERKQLGLGSHFSIGFNDSKVKSGKVSKRIELPYLLPVAEYAIQLGTKGVGYNEVLSNLRFDFINNGAENRNKFFVDKEQILPTDLAALQNTYIKTFRDYSFEPKIYHSQFSPIFLSFYSDSMLIKNEKFKIDQSIYFSFNYNLADYSRVKIGFDGSTDYELSQVNELQMVVDTSNEIATVSNDIKDYVEFMYNNDMKQIELQKKQISRSRRQEFVNLGSSVVSSAVAGGIAGSIAGGVGALPGAVAAGGATLIKGGINIIYSMKDLTDKNKKMELDYENKMLNLQSNLVNIAGASPELNKINDNDKLKVWRLGLQSYEYDYLRDFFHKYGYRTLEFKKITLQTRQMFDYKQVMFEDLKSNYNLDLQVKSDILRRWSEGVTIFHLFDLSLEDSYNLYENKEVNVV